MRRLLERSQIHRPEPQATPRDAPVAVEDDSRGRTGESIAAGTEFLTVLQTEFHQSDSLKFNPAGFSGRAQESGNTERCDLLMGACISGQPLAAQKIRRRGIDRVIGR